MLSGALFLNVNMTQRISGCQFYWREGYGVVGNITFKQLVVNILERCRILFLYVVPEIISSLNMFWSKIIFIPPISSCSSYRDIHSSFVMVVNSFQLCNGCK